MNLNHGTLLAKGHYVVKAVLGHGGFGITYLGEQVGLGRKVAIKEFFMQGLCNRDPETKTVLSVGDDCAFERLKADFIKHARFVAKFSCNHIIKIDDIFEENGTAYCVMGFLDGKSLHDIVESDGPMSENEALGYIRQVALALGEMHTKKMLHLGVKPTNIMLNNKDEAVLMDFSLSRRYDENDELLSASSISINAGFAPIEQYVEGELETFSPSADIYSLAATLFFLLTGEVPPEASVVQEDGLPALPVNISKDTANAILKTMCSKRRERPKNVAEFLELLDGGAKVVEPEPVPQLQQKKSYGAALKVALAVFASLVMVFLIVQLAPEVEQALVPTIEERYEDALDFLDSTDAEDVREGIELMDALANEKYIPAMSEVAHTYGWYSDSLSQSRKKLLGIKCYTTNGSEFMPIESKFNDRARELFVGIIESEQEGIMDKKAHAALRLAAYSANKNSSYAQNFDKALEYLKMARGFAAVAHDNALIEYIDQRIDKIEDIIEMKKEEENVSASPVVYKEVGESIKR